jgi:hypothetical protein
VINPSFWKFCAIQRLDSKGVDKATLSPIYLVSFARKLSRPDVVLWRRVKLGYVDQQDCPMRLINHRAYLGYKVHRLTK